QPYILASLNLNASKIDSEVWTSSENNTNALKIIDTQNKFGVPYSRHKRNNKNDKVLEDIINTTNENLKRKDFELEEKKMALKECELQILTQEAATRGAIIKAEALELANLEKKKSL
ncbi:9446_t:CDS:2, partial [Diversispora eburnea]